MERNLQRCVSCTVVDPKGLRITSMLKPRRKSKFIFNLAKNNFLLWGHLVRSYLSSWHRTAAFQEPIWDVAVKPSLLHYSITISYKPTTAVKKKKWGKKIIQGTPSPLLICRLVRPGQLCVPFFRSLPFFKCKHNGTLPKYFGCDTFRPREFVLRIIYLQTSWRKADN